MPTRIGIVLILCRDLSRDRIADRPQAGYGRANLTFVAAVLDDRAHEIGQGDRTNGGQTVAALRENLHLVEGTV